MYRESCPDRGHLPVPQPVILPLEAHLDQIIFGFLPASAESQGCPAFVADVTSAE